MSIGGTIKQIQPVLKEGRLQVRARVLTESGRVEQAFLPDRELSALLPRCLLAEPGREAPEELLEVISSIIGRMARGRRVKMWSYQGRNYVSFLSWRSIRFRSPASC